MSDFGAGPSSIDDRPITPSTVNTDELKHSPASDISASVHAALSQGLVAGWSQSDGIKTVDPANFASDVDAAQNVADYLAAATEPSGTLFLPSSTTDGTLFEFSKTLTINASGSVDSISVKMPNIGGQRGGTSMESLPKVSITDGSPAIEIGSNDTNDGGAFGYVVDVGLDFNNNQAVGLKLNNSVNFETNLLATRGGDGGTGYQLDGVSNGQIDGDIRGNSTTFDIVSCLGTNDDSHWNMAPSFQTEGTYRCLLTDRNSASQITVARIDGRHEGADASDAAAEAYIELKKENSSVQTSSTLHLGRSTNGADGIYHAATNGNGALFVHGGYFTALDGTAINVDGSLTFMRIGSSTAFNPYNIGGDAIRIASDTDQPSIVPSNAMIPTSVSYPSGTNKLRTIDSTTL